MAGEEERMKLTDPTNSAQRANTAEPLGQNLMKIITNVCFGAFVFAVLIFTVIAVTYQPPDPWLQSPKALAKIFSADENATFQQDESILQTGEDMNLTMAQPPAVMEEHPITQNSVAVEEKEALPAMAPTPDCDPNQAVVNCSDPIMVILVKRFNLKVFPNIVTFDYQKPVNGSKQNECDVGWKFRSKKEKSWRKYRDFRRFTFGFDLECNYKITGAGKWHSGKNAQPARIRREPTQRPKSNNKGGSHPSARPSTPITVNELINDSVPVLKAESSFRKSKYLYYSRGGDYCKHMNHYLWSFLCALGEAQYLNRTFVMDMSICLSPTYSLKDKEEEGKDFRYYFDFEHLKESASVIEEGQFLKEWKKWNREHKRDQIPVRKVTDYKVTPMQLRKDKSSIIWRQFDEPEPNNYWYRVCEGRAEKYIHRPWQMLWKSKHLTNIVSSIAGRLDWDFDAVHVIRGEKAENKERWPNLDRDTSPDALLAKLTNVISFRRNLFIATNEPDPHYFDRLRAQFKVFLLDDFSDLWGKNSEWYNETLLINNGQPVDFDGYMRVEVDTEVFFRGKTRVETFYNLTRDCKDGINTC